jgi:hypothetical protein
MEVSEGRGSITDCSPDIMLLIFLVVAVAVTIVGIGPTRAAATLLLFFVNETLAGCVESVRDVYWWIAAETIVGAYSGGLVVDLVVRGALTGEFSTEKGMMYCSTSTNSGHIHSVEGLSRRASRRTLVTLANLDLTQANVLMRKG